MLQKYYYLLLNLHISFPMISHESLHIKGGGGREKFINVGEELAQAYEWLN